VKKKELGGVEGGGGAKKREREGAIYLLSVDLFFTKPKR
jgi:hypothetical protein